MSSAVPRTGRLLGVSLHYSSEFYYEASYTHVYSVALGLGVPFDLLDVLLEYASGSAPLTGRPRRSRFATGTPSGLVHTGICGLSLRTPVNNAG